MLIPPPVVTVDFLISGIRSISWRMLSLRAKTERLRFSSSTSLIEKEPIAEKYIKKYVNAKELILKYYSWQDYETKLMTKLI